MRFPANSLKRRPSCVLQRLPERMKNSEKFREFLPDSELEAQFLLFSNPSNREYLYLSPGNKALPRANHQRESLEFPRFSGRDPSRISRSENYYLHNIVLYTIVFPIYCRYQFKSPRGTESVSSLMPQVKLSSTVLCLSESKYRAAKALRCAAWSPQFWYFFAEKLNCCLSNDAFTEVLHFWKF